MKKRIITALNANKIALIVAAVLVMLSYMLYVICNISTAYHHWHVYGYLFFITFVAATSMSCIALSGLIYGLLNPSDSK